MIPSRCRFLQRINAHHHTTINERAKRRRTHTHRQWKKKKKNLFLSLSFSHTQINRRKMINHSDLWSVLLLYLVSFSSSVSLYLLTGFHFFSCFLYKYSSNAFEKTHIPTQKHHFWFFSSIPDDCWRSLTEGNAQQQHVDKTKKTDAFNQLRPWWFFVFFSPPKNSHDINEEKSFFTTTDNLLLSYIFCFSISHSLLRFDLPPFSLHCIPSLWFSLFLLMTLSLLDFMDWPHPLFLLFLFSLHQKKKKQQPNTQNRVISNEKFIDRSGYFSWKPKMSHTHKP